MSKLNDVLNTACQVIPRVNTRLVAGTSVSKILCLNLKDAQIDLLFHEKVLARSRKIFTPQLVSGTVATYHETGELASTELLNAAQKRVICVYEGGKLCSEERYQGLRPKQGKRRIFPDKTITDSHFFPTVSSHVLEKLMHMDIMQLTNVIRLCHAHGKDLTLDDFKEQISCLNSWRYAWKNEKVAPLKKWFRVRYDYRVLGRYWRHIFLSRSRQ